jgi:aminoglycoside phosphotransferase
VTTTTSPPQLPASLAALIEPGSARPLDATIPAESAFEVRTVDGAVAVLRVGRPGDDGLGDLRRRLEWLRGRVVAPVPLGFDVCDGRELLLTSPVAGTSAMEVEYRVDAVRTVQFLGAALADIHRIDVSDCPFVIDVAALVDGACRRLRAPADPVDPLQIDPAVAHVASERLADVLEQGLARYAAVTEPVLCLGRPSVQDFRLETGRPVGFEGWDQCGAGDRYLDLATLAAGVARDLTPHLVPVLFESYGLDRPELGRLDWYQLLDSVR